VVELGGLHHMPQFARDPEALYAQLVYAGHGSDVRDVLCQGQWLMRERELLTLDEQSLLAEAADVARRIDAFLVEREESVLSKLLVIGQVAQQKMFEVQVKVLMSEPPAEDFLDRPEFVVLKPSTRLQYDTYFLFDDQYRNRLRHREDEVLEEHGAVRDVVYRLTLTTETKEREFENSVLLSRSRFDAPATRSVRFYREYFKPADEVMVHKERRRCHLRYGGTDFAVNLDRLLQPELPGVFLEIKSRTWSRQDAERKADLITELLDLFGVQAQELVKQEYLDLALETGRLLNG
jgi:5-methylthioadenosine/S-adenosylhomocysteine deaminase